MRKIFKNRHIIVLLLVALIGATCLAACGGDEVTTTVTYYVNGSVHGTASVTTGMTSSGVADPAVDGFTFEGWFTDEACTTPFDFAAYAADENRVNITVYAKMVASGEPAQVNTITYYVQGSVYDTVTVEGNVLSKNVADPSLDGYTFGGWYTDQSYSATFDLPAYVNSAERADILVYARMIAEDGEDPAPVKVTVIFNVNGGEGNYPVQEYESGDRLADLPTPERENHTFAGWQTADGTVYEDGSVVPARDLELIAQWTPDPSTVTLTFGDKTIGTIELTQGEDYVIDPIPGYTLVDWKLAGKPVTDADGASLSPWQYVGGEYTLTATANAIVYQVTYELNGGENAFSNPDSFSIEDMDGDIEGSIALDDPSFDSEFIEATAAADGSIAVKSNGKQFLGWFTDPEFTNKVTALTLSLGDVTLYASWGEDALVTRNVPYLRVNSDNEPDENGAYLLFGAYPQTFKKSSVTVSSDTDAYGNYTGSDGAFYRRATATPFADKYTFSDYTIIENKSVYYFKLEPLRWNITSTSDGKTLIVSERIIAASQFGNNNGYSGSALRSWMNTMFGSAGVFSDQQRELIAETNVDGNNDRIFALSTTEYNTMSSSFRTKSPTDYALAVGVEKRTSGSGAGNGTWWLRSPYGSTANVAVAQAMDGTSPSDPGKKIGVVPALNIILY